jgi:puromycin-sensitive aminopeptidase
MTIPSSKTALSCMDVLGIEQNPEKNESTYTFSETPLMSTYLLAMCVGNYDFLEDNSKTGTKVRIYTNQGGLSCLYQKNR